VKKIFLSEGSMKTKIKCPNRLIIICMAVIIFPAFVFLFLALDTQIHEAYSDAIISDPVFESPDLTDTSAAVSIQALSSAEQALFGVPIRIKIPTIKVNAFVESIGLTKGGAVGAPKIPENAAWYNLGPRPGEIGNALIVGHFGPWLNGRKSVFNNINKLKKGDIISVADKKGVMVNFKVRESKSYGPKDDVSEVFISNDGKAHLNLITCQGVWDKILKLYSKRLVVFTDRE